MDRESNSRAFYVVENEGDIETEFIVDGFVDIGEETEIKAIYKQIENRFVRVSDDIFTMSDLENIKQELECIFNDNLEFQEGLDRNLGIDYSDSIINEELERENENEG